MIYCDSEGCEWAIAGAYVADVWLVSGCRFKGVSS